MKNTKIQKNDRIQVTSHGVTKSGIVKTANDWGDEHRSDWYIEFAEDGNGLTVYVKEQYDNATIVKI